MQTSQRLTAAAESARCRSQIACRRVGTTTRGLPKRTSTIVRFADGKVNIDELTKKALPDLGDRITAGLDTGVLTYDSIKKFLTKPAQFMQAIDPHLEIMFEKQRDTILNGKQLTMERDGQKLRDAMYAAALVNASYLVPKAVTAGAMKDEDIRMRVKKEVAKVIFGPTGTPEQLTDANFWMPHTVSKWMDPVTFVALDPKNKRFVLCIRGSVDTFDWICDGVGRPYKPDSDNVFAPIGNVHQGMYIAAQTIITEMAVELFKGPAGKPFKDAFNDPDYQIFVAGHSLGGGVCGMVSVLLNNFYGCEGRVKGVCFAPAQVLDPEHAAACSHYVDSYVYGSDIVPRLSSKGLVGLMKQVDGETGPMTPARAARAEWWRNKLEDGLYASLLGKLSFGQENVAAFMGEKLTLLDKIDQMLKPAVESIRGPLDNDEYDLSQQLCIPGTAHWILPRDLLTNDNPYYPKGEGGSFVTVDTNIYQVDDCLQTFGDLLVAQTNPTKQSVASKASYEEVHKVLTCGNDHSMFHYLWAVEQLNNVPHWIETGLSREDARLYKYFLDNPSAEEVSWIVQKTWALSDSWNKWTAPKATAVPAVQPALP